MYSLSDTSNIHVHNANILPP